MILKLIEGVNVVLIKKCLLTLPRSRSHIRLEIGKSINLLSTMLFAMKVPAILNTSETY